MFENHVHSIRPVESGPTVELSLWDTAGQEDFDMLRSLSYADTHVIMLCFAVDNPISLENVESRVSLSLFPSKWGGTLADVIVWARSGCQRYKTTVLA